MSIALIDVEVRRFLASSHAEVLCIKGRWGVGKTYGWRGFLKAAKDADALGMDSYAYVSLFGLNSLDELRYALFENTVSGENVGRDPDEATLSERIRDKDLARRLKPMLDAAAQFFNRKGLVDLLAKSAFLTIRKQLVCFDDLERAGLDLTTRQVLGLTSFLKESRKCKVVLLLNDEEHDEKTEFERQLEKVADVTLRFDPTAEEAAAIALAPGSRLAELVGPRTVALGITNIRTIKKIERLAQRLIEHLDGYDGTLVSEAVATLVLASWAVQQPRSAPPLDFLRNYNEMGLSMRMEAGEHNADIVRYQKMIERYPFTWASELDRVIIDGAERGFFLEEPLRQTADSLADEMRKNSRDTAFTRAWNELYHGALVADDDAFLDALHTASIEEAAVITPLNINSAIKMLRGAGRNEQADAVVASYVEAHRDEARGFFDVDNHHFLRGEVMDPALNSAFSDRLATYVDARDPLEVLRSIGARSGWSEEDERLLSKLVADDFERLFEALRGDEIKPSIEMARAIGRQHRIHSQDLDNAITEALQRIAAKSPLSAQKLRNIGIVVADDDDAAHSSDRDAAE